MTSRRTVLLAGLTACVLIAVLILRGGGPPEVGVAGAGRAVDATADVEARIGVPGGGSASASGEDPDFPEGGSGRSRLAGDEPAFAIEGRVVDSLGRGVAGARVEVRSVNDLLARGAAAPLLGAATSGEDGRFRAEDVVGHRLALDARAGDGRRGMRFLYEDVVDGVAAGVEVEVQGTRSVSGIVRDSEGHPVPGAYVQPSGLASNIFYWQACEARCDDEGRFELIDLPSRAGQVWAWAEGFVAGRTEIPSHGGELDARLERGQGHTILARLEGGTIPGATLECQGMGSAREELLPSPLRVTSFDGEGSARVSSLPAGTWFVRVVGHGGRVKQRGQRVELDADHPIAHVSFTTVPLLPLTGRLVDREGRALPGTRMEFLEPGETYRSRTVVSGGDGAFHIDAWAVEGGRNQLTLVTPGLYFDTEHGPRTFRLVSPGSDQDLFIRRGPTLAGRVVDERGRPVGRATVLLFPGGGMQKDVLAVSTADEDGSFVLTPRWPKEPRPVRIGARFGERVGLRGEDLTLGEGTRLQGIEVEIQLGTIVEGIVLDVDNRPLPDLFLTLRPVSVPHAYLLDYAFAKVTSAADGRFRFRGLPAGKWQLGGYFGKRYCVDPMPLVELETGQVRAGIVLHFAEGLDIAGTVVDLDGKPPSDLVKAELVHRPSAGVRRQPSQSGMIRRIDGSFRLGGLAPGAWRLELSWVDGERRKRRFFTRGSIPERRFVVPEPVEAGTEGLRVTLPIGANAELAIEVPEELVRSEAAGFELGLELRGGGSEARAVRCGTDGLIREPLPPGSYAWALSHPARGTERGSFELAPGQAHRLRAFAEGGDRTVKVHVLDEEGRPVPGARVTLAGRVPGGASPYVGAGDDPAWGLATDEDGTVRVTPSARPATIFAAGAGRGLVVGTWSGQDEVRLVAGPGGDAHLELGPVSRGRVVEDARWAVVVRRLGPALPGADPAIAAGIEATISGGSPLALRFLPPGRYRLEAQAPGEAGPVEATVPGRSVVHEFDVAPGKPYRHRL
ncbi:MAG: hypothetical protein R3F30_03520 [Planctomycetota bacterium]